MSNPLKLRLHANGVYNDGVQLMTDAEMDYLCEKILIKYATESASGDYTADLNIDSTGSSVGTFVDQFADEELGSHSSPAISSTTYTFKTNATSTSETSMVYPLTSNGSAFMPQTSSELNSTIIARCLDKLAVANTTAAETGTYYVGTSAPSIAGTWVQQDLFYDELTNHANDDDEKVTYKLWRKSSHPSATVIRSLKLSGSSNVHQMTDAEIETLTARLRNRIISTGVGTYKFQASAPGTGTWVARGSATNRTPNLSNQQYTGEYAAQYEGQYGRSFARSFGRQFARTYSAQYESQFLRQFVRVYSGNYDGPSYAVQYARGTAGGLYTRANYARVYSANYERSYTRQTPGPQYTAVQNYTRVVIPGEPGDVYQGPILYTRTRPGPQYTRETNSTQYDGDQFTRTTLGPQYTGQYGRIYVGPSYSATYTRETDSTQYNEQYTRIYSGPYSVNYARAQYTRQRPGWGYAQTYAVTYLRVFTEQYTRGQYTRVAFSQYTRVATAQYTRETPGPQYTRETPGPQYTRETDSTQYSRQTPGSNYGPVYSGQYSRIREGSYPYFRDAYDGVMYDYVLGPTPFPYYRTQQFYRAFSRGQYGSAAYMRDSYTNFYAGPPYSPQGATFYFRDGNSPGLSNQVAHLFEYYSRNPGYSGSYSRGFYGSGALGVPYSTEAYIREFATQYTRTTTPGIEYLRIYSAQYTRVATAQYTRVATANYTRETDSTQYTRETPSDQYTGQYTRNRPGPYYARTYYTRQPFYYRFYASTQYSRLYSVTYTRQRTGPQYDGTQYTRVAFGSYTDTNSYTRERPGPNYERQFQREFQGQYNEQYTRVATAQYGRIYQGGYSRQFARIYSDTYSRSFARETAGPSYADQYERTFIGQYDRVLYLRGTYTRQTLGPAYDGAQYGVQFTRADAGPQYTTNYDGAQYTTQYTGQYAGSRFKQYTGLTVQSTTTDDTKTLWLRVA